MEEQVKLVTAITTQNQKLQFIVYKDHTVGKGAFGSVLKAYQVNRKDQQLVVKIVPYKDQKQKQKINKQIQIIKSLPQHPNIVKVLPLKCFSKNNFYIFMQYCKGGTLGKQLECEGRFDEEKMFNLFYQVLEGYRVLWNKKILHQDLKPENILVKNGNYKITDFGFSIFYEGVKHGSKRLGTLYYMPLEKLLQAEYYANCKSDVFALGVIFFKALMGRHPYLIKNVKNYKQYIQQLRQNTIQEVHYITSKMTMDMKHLYEVIVRMLAKKPEDRASFQEIFQFMETQKKFLALQQSRKQKSKQKSQRIDVLDLFPKAQRIVEHSSTIAIPFSVNMRNEQGMAEQLRTKLRNEQQIERKQVCQKIENYLVSMRLIVYFFDRLTRRIYVEMSKKQGSNQTASIQLIILSLIYYQKKVTTEVLREARKPVRFQQTEWQFYKTSDPIMLKMIQKDYTYIEDIIISGLVDSKQIKVDEKMKIMNKAQNEDLPTYSKIVQESLMKLIDSRKDMIPINDCKYLTTLMFAFTALDILGDFSKWIEQGIKLEQYFRQIEILSNEQLLSRVIKNFEAINLDYTLDLGEQPIANV